MFSFVGRYFISRQRSCMRNTLSADSPTISMSNQVGANYSFNSFVVAAENQSFTAQSFCEAEYVEPAYEEDEYGCTSSSETLELLHGLSQKARESLEVVKAEQEAKSEKARSRAEFEASQRLRGKAELPENNLPTAHITKHFGKKDLVPTMVRAMKAVRKGVETSPECVDTGIKRMLKEFQDDEILCTRLATHLSSESAKLFCTGDIKNSTLNIYSPYGLPLIWKKSSASKYSALSSFERGEQKGIHERGVDLLWFHEALTDHGYRCYVGSGRSAQGGMILRALQHGDPKHRAKNPTTHLYKHLGQPGTTHRVYRLARWPAIDEVPSKEETFDEILLVEMLWQIRLAQDPP